MRRRQWMAFGLAAAAGCAGDDPEREARFRPVFQLCGQYLQEENVEAALDTCQKAEEIFSDDPDLKATLGVIHMNRNQDAVAERYFQEALAIDPEHPQAHTNYGSLLSRQKKHREAIEHYESALANPASNTFTLHLNYGQACRELGQTSCAEDHYGKALREQPRSCYANFLMGQFQEEAGKYDLSVERYGLCVQECGDSASCRFRLGETLLQQGKSREAMVQFRHICEKLPRSAEATASCRYVTLSQGAGN